MQMASPCVQRELTKSLIYNQEKQIMDAIDRLSEIRDKLTHLDVLMRPSETLIFQDYCDNHELPMIMVEEDTTVIYCNKAMSKFMGMPLDKIVGEKVKNWWTGDKGTQAYKTLKETGKLQGQEIQFKTPRGDCSGLVYSSVHRGNDDEWLNSRCLVVPLEN